MCPVHTAPPPSALPAFSHEEITELILPPSLRCIAPTSHTSKQTDAAATEGSFSLKSSCGKGVMHGTAQQQKPSAPPLPLIVSTLGRKLLHPSCEHHKPCSFPNAAL
jgi:hypothetical protein